MSTVDVAVIRAALAELPSKCRYHGDPSPRRNTIARQACCDTGIPALARRRADEALDRLAEALAASEAKVAGAWDHGLVSGIGFATRVQRLPEADGPPRRMQRDQQRGGLSRRHGGFRAGHTRSTREA